MPPIDAAYTTPSDLLANQFGTAQRQAGGHPLNIFVAAGPYTLDVDLDYAPLEELVKAAEQERPDLLILVSRSTATRLLEANLTSIKLGPFVDQDHSLIKAGDVDNTPLQIFQRQVSSRLNALVKASPRTTVILVPHGRDMVSSHCAFPQSPLDKQELGMSNKVKLLPNPASFSANEVTFGVCSVDTVLHLRNQEFFRRAGEVASAETVADVVTEADAAAAKDVMARTCRHMLRQRSYYPIFPSPQPSGAIKEPVNLDVTHHELVKMPPTGSDVVIAPSMLKHFVKVVDSTVFVNPSYLIKPGTNTAGTYARLTVHPLPKHELERRVRGDPDQQLDPDEPIEHRVWERCRVDIIKI